MKELNAEKIEMLPKFQKDALFNQIENNIHHTQYEQEVMFYSCIENGDTDGLQKRMDEFLNNSVVVGRMSNNDLRQMQYFAVCCITLASRSAIRGGLSEITVFNLADKYIQAVDAVTDAREIPPFLSKKAFEITELVKENKARRDYPSSVQKAIYFIESNLYANMSPADAAEFCGLSKDYLNILFRKHVGTTLGKYITRAKLHESKRLLTRGFSVSDTAYQLGFCSESYFVTCYKREFGATPGSFKRLYNR